MYDQNTGLRDHSGVFMNSGLEPACRPNLGGVPAIFIATVLCLSMGGSAGVAYAQEAVATAAPEGHSAAEIETLIAPIALYPDELMAIVLPASTFPLQIVQAARFLEKQKTDASLEPDENWDSSVLSLLNYPEVIQLMNEDLDWTWKLGEDVVNRQQDVMAAIQRFRTKADEAGNLATNEQTVVIKETEVIKIESASPEVIYVPTYDPTTVVVYQSAPYPYVYSAPYPYYYSPAATFWSGMFVGAAISYGVHWHNHNHGHGYGDIDIDRNTEINRDSTNVNRDSIKESSGERQNSRDRTSSDRGSTDRGSAERGSSNNWRSDRSSQQGGRPGRQPSSVSGRDFSSRTGSSAGTRVGDGGTRSAQGNVGAADRSASRQSSDRTRERSGTGQPDMGSGSRQRSSGGSFGGYQSGATTARYSQRGASSRSGMSRSSRGGGGGRRR